MRDKQPDDFEYHSWRTGLKVVKRYDDLIIHLIPKKIQNARTNSFMVTTKEGAKIGKILWPQYFGQYVFETHCDFPISLTKSHMRDICHFIDHLTEQRKK